MPSSASKSSPRASPSSGGTFEEAGVEDELADIDRQMEMPGFWDRPEQSGELLRRRRQVERRVETLNKLRADAGDLEAWQELLGDGAGQADPDAAAFVERLGGELDRLELQLKLAGPDDERNAIVAINSGAGGTESQDWAEMLLRMYVRWAEQREFDVELLDRQDGEEAGIKSATFAVRGEYAFGLLHGESGVHRLVRISPFDSASRRHTSFAGVDVVPEVEVNDVEINEEDLRVDTYRSQGAGGQHVNTSDSAVRITHLPTGIVVACQNERSQLQNKNRAMQILASRLAEHARAEQAKEIATIRGEQTEAGWGRQIRSYVLQPYQLVKDLRTDLEVGNVGGVLDGDIEPFMDAYLQWRRAAHENE